MTLSWRRLFPVLAWRERITPQTLRADITAALTGALIVLPQGVAFATLAGLPPQYGLYAAMAPAVVAALWGSSWHLVSGPTNAISLVTLAVVSTLAEPGSARYIELTLTLSFMVGALQLALGLARLGAVVNFVSHTVVVGFTAGAALLIITSQMKNFFGLDSIPRGALFFRVIDHFSSHLAEINPWVTLTSLITLAGGLLAKRLVPRFPYMIAAMLCGALAAGFINLQIGAEHSGIRMVGALPGAVPQLSSPHFHWDTLRELMSAAVAVTVLALAEAVSIARSIAVKSGQLIDGNQEFIGQGLSNLVGAFFSAYPSSGSFNRSGVNYQSGAQTPLAAAISAPMLMLLLVFIAPWAAYLPNAAMAGVLFLVAWGLFDFHHIAVIWRSSRSESAVLLLTFAATMVLHLEEAILLGVALSLLFFLMRTAQPAIRVLLPDAAHNRKFLEVRPGQAECPQIKIVRIEGVLYFGVVNAVARALQGFFDQHRGQKRLLLMSKSINFIDVAGAELLAQEAAKRRTIGGGLYFYSLREAAGAMLEKPDYAAAIGKLADCAYASKAQAISACVEHTDANICRDCKARVFLECANRPCAHNDSIISEASHEQTS